MPDVRSQSVAASHNGDEESPRTCADWITSKAKTRSSRIRL